MVHEFSFEGAFFSLIAGLDAQISGAVAAALYAIHCNDDSPLFVATWYTLAIGLTTIVGSLLGRRFLRW